MAPPIDNADKKTFLQWNIGKGIKYFAFQIAITVFYLACTIIGTMQYFGYSVIILGKNEFIFLMIALNIIYWVNFYMSYRNYIHDKKGDPT